MKFLRIRPREAVGDVIAHNIFDAVGRRIATKGQLLTAENISKLSELDRAFVYVARLEADDAGENEAALRVAAAVLGAGVFSPHAATGRANLKAATAGLLRVKIEAIEALNEIDDGITLMTLPNHSLVASEQLVATVKIIPFAVPRKSVDTIERFCAKHMPVISVAALRAQRTGLIVTAHQGVTLPHPAHPSLVISQHEALALAFKPALGARLQQAGSSIFRTDFAEHEVDDLARAMQQQLLGGCDIIRGC